jgi:carbon starvation protein CstA
MMIAEGIIAMIWAAAGMSLFNGSAGLSEILANGGPGAVVSEVSTLMLGAIGGTLAVIGVIILPITSGDTAFRSARMIIADYFKISQAKIVSRLWIAIPLFVLSFVLTNMDFEVLWRYFSWANQSTAVIALWVGSMYLFIARKQYYIAMIPAIFMTMATSTYILNAPIGFRLPIEVSYIGAAMFTIIIIGLFYVKAMAARKTDFVLDTEDITNEKAA